MTDPRNLHRRAGDMTSEVITHVRPDQLGRATPCTEWDLRALINHVVGGNLRFVAMVTSEPGPGADDDVLGNDPLESFRDSLHQLCSVFGRPGFLEQTYPTPFGEGPGTVLVEMRVVELTVHSWDLAAASGQRRDLDPELVGFADGILRSRPIPRGEAGPFGPEKPAPVGAPGADRLAAFAGRIVPA